MNSEYKVYEVLSKEDKFKPNDVRVSCCPHCLAENLVKSYTCLNCFKVIQTNEVPPIWKRTWPVNRAVILFCILFCLSGTLIIRGGLTRVENHILNLQEENQSYYAAVENCMMSKVDSLK